MLRLLLRMMALEWIMRDWKVLFNFKKDETVKTFGLNNVALSRVHLSGKASVPYWQPAGTGGQNCR